MKVEAKADRKFDDEGNQVLVVSGSVISDTQQPVLPQAKLYRAEIVGAGYLNGAMNFEFHITAMEPKAEKEAEKLPAQLSRFEQEELYLKSLLEKEKDPAARQAILEKLGQAPEPEAEDGGEASV